MISFVVNSLKQIVILRFRASIGPSVGCVFYLSYHNEKLLNEAAVLQDHGVQNHSQFFKIEVLSIKAAFGEAGSVRTVFKELNYGLRYFTTNWDLCDINKSAMLYM
ncbi:hypothetical protein Hdeb2414_s0135g00808281 [Helianthus debilis subsp. tardiflorus]